MSGKQFIKFCPVAPRHSRRVGDVAFGDLQQLTQIVEFKLIARFDEGRQRGIFPFQRLFHQRITDAREYQLRR